MGPYKCPECGFSMVHWSYDRKRLFCMSYTCNFRFECKDIPGLDGPTTDIQAIQLLNRAKEEYEKYKAFCDGKHGIQFIQPDGGK